MAEANFSAAQKAEILAAIKEAENKTSGEIIVHIENRCRIEVLDRAAEVFDKLGLHKTAARNGVLIYLAVKDHKFAILGDSGINLKTGEHFWTEIKEVMSDKFRSGDFTGGLISGIQMAGEKLKIHFPYEKGDKNELRDEISFGS